MGREGGHRAAGAGAVMTVFVLAVATACVVVAALIIRGIL